MSANPSSGISLERLEEIRRLRAAISEAPWTVQRDSRPHCEVANVQGVLSINSAKMAIDERADARFIAASPQIVDDLLAENERLTQLHAEADAIIRRQDAQHAEQLARFRGDGERLDWLEAEAKRLWEKNWLRDEKRVAISYGEIFRAGDLRKAIDRLRNNVCAFPRCDCRTRCADTQARGIIAASDYPDASDAARASRTPGEG